MLVTMPDTLTNHDTLRTKLPSRGFKPFGNLVRYSLCLELLVDLVLIPEGPSTHMVDTSDAKYGNYIKVKVYHVGVRGFSGEGRET